jgi:predicted lipoprotein with Yx(FWY)xxD motif
MTSIRVQLGIIPIVAGALVFAACGGTSAAGSAASPSTPPLIHTASMKVGDRSETVMKNVKGLTLYYFALDTSTSIACTASCASNWPPLLATAATPTSNPTLPGELSVLNGPNGNQVLYNGHPLYTYIKDGVAADAFGQGVGGKWFVATPDLAAAVAASSTPIY